MVKYDWCWPTASTKALSASCARAVNSFEERYSSHLELKREPERHEMSCLDRRRNDKAFGRFIESAKKQMKD